MTAELAMMLFWASLMLFYIAAMAFTVTWWQPMDPRDLAKRRGADAGAYMSGRP